MEVSRMAPKCVHTLIPGTCNYVILHDKRDSTDVTKVIAGIRVRAKRYLKHERDSMESMRRNVGSF